MIDIVAEPFERQLARIKRYVPFDAYLFGSRSKISVGPDSWVILKITRPEGVLHKVLAGWSGGYLEGSSWRINSGIVRANHEGDYIIFEGHSGSQYKCHKSAQRLSRATEGFYESLRQQAEQTNITLEIVDEFEG